MARKNKEKNHIPILNGYINVKLVLEYVSGIVDETAIELFLDRPFDASMTMFHWHCSMTWWSYNEIDLTKIQ